MHSSTNACKCGAHTFSEEVSTSTQIFTGTVLKKTVAEKAYYLFSVSKVFKGDEADTITIRTGFGGPDCGMVFEVGKTYVVYAYNKTTSWCRRNAPAVNNADIGMLKFLFDTVFCSEIGKTTNPELTDNEAEYFNIEFLKTRNGFDFKGKNVAFISNRSFIDKRQYFMDWGGKETAVKLVILTNKERRNNGYDAIIILSQKQTVGNGFKKRLIKKLNRLALQKSD